MSETTIQSYRNMLPVNKHRLDDELEIQPDIMERIARQVVVMTSRMMEAKDDLSRLEGRLSEDAKDADPKLSLPATEAKVRRSPERVRAWERYQRARAEQEEWSHMLEAWRQKGFSIKTLADLYAAAYFSLDSIGMSRRQQERMANQDEARAEMRRNGQRAQTIEQEEPIAISLSRRRVLRS